MTSTQFLILLGTIYIAPHLDEKYCLVVGCLFLCVATAREVFV